LQWRAERRVEHLSEQVYGAAWAWLPTPLWLTLVDPAASGAELARLVQVWRTRRRERAAAHLVAPHRTRPRRSLPVLPAR
jgi:hypothetical protein